ncbi:MAG: response regulator [Alphaproteobacteria bacterium]|nr:response regulator [Alphaproteobacteria bacterium]
MAEKTDFSVIRFLVVDSNRLFLDMIKDVLAMMGATSVLRATDADKAKKLLREESVDIVITEWNLEGQTGVDLLEHIRTSSESPNRLLPVLMLTANSEEDYVLAARDRGVTEFLAKPFSVQNFYDCLVAIIARPRSFVDADSYFGLDRRRRQTEFNGPDRRAAS